MKFRDNNFGKFVIRKFISLLSISLFTSAGLVAQNAPVTVTVDAQAKRHAISSLIYGIAYGDTATLSDLNAPLNRYGGNNSTRYNWQANADNKGSDYYFESIGDSDATPAGRGDSFITGSRAGGAEPLITIPMIGWVAKLGGNRGKLASFSIAKYGAQTGSDYWFPDAGNGVHTNGSSVTGNDPTDANVLVNSAYQASWAQHMISTFGHAGSGGLRYYVLDNEHSIWFSTHRDVAPIGAHATDIRDRIVDYASQIHAVDPGAQVIGPEEWGWGGYRFSGFDQQTAAGNGYSYYPDRQTVMNGQDYIPWLLSQWKASGVKPLDIVSVHYYPQSGEFSSDTSTNTQLLRNQSTRSLWDPAYTDQSWIASQVQLIPRLKSWVSSSYYPGTPVAITEYNWGAENHINGATTQADILGIFGRESLDMATRWTFPDPSTPTYKAMKLYRNYDGNRGSFGDTSVSTTVPNPDNLSAFSAVRSSDNALTVMVINKVLSGATPVTVSLANFAPTGQAAVYQLTSANTITSLPNMAVSASSVSLTVPAQSITLLVIPGGSATPPTNKLPVASFTATPASGQAPATVSFDGSASVDPDGTVATYAWSFGDGKSANGSKVSHLYSAAGVFSASLTVTDNSGATNTLAKTITIAAANKPPVAVIGATPSNGPAPLSVSFSSTGSNDPDGSIASYAWAFGDGATSTGATASHSYASAGTFTATLTVTDNQGAKGTASKVISVTAPGGGAAACAVTYKDINDWGNGFQGDIILVNKSSTAWNSWTLGWTFSGNQIITNLWNGTVTQSGKSVSVLNVYYNNQVAAGGSVEIGFIANYSGTNAKPTTFMVGGKTCAVQ